MEKIFLIFPKTHVNLSPELGICTILNSFIYNYFSSISSNFFESKILITSAGLKKKSIEFGFPSRRRENEPLLHPNSQDQTINLIPKMQKWKRIRTGWCNLFRNRVCGKERGCGSSQTSPASGHDVVPSSFSLSLSLSRFPLFGLLVRSKSWPRVSQQRFLRGARRVALIRLPFLAPMLRAISYTVLSSNLYLSTRQSGGS